MEPTRAPLAHDAQQQQQGSLLTVPAFINGRSVPLSSTFPVVSPYTGHAAWLSASVSPADALDAVAAAQAAFPAWVATKPSRRRDILLKAAALLEERTELHGAVMRTEMGADLGSSDGFVVPLGTNMLRECASRISAVVQGTVPIVDAEGQSAMIVREPVGVVLGIVPWNAPFVFGCRSIGSALAAGCTTVIKATEMTPRCYYLLACAFADAGLPPGCLNVISCRPEDAAAVTRIMIEHSAVRKINFTGSTSVGRQVASLCGQNLKPCLMELGGKNAAIVLADADLPKAALQCVLGGFLNSGQICMSTDRVLVHEAVAEPFIEALRAVMTNVFIEQNPPPTIVSEASRNRILGVVEDAKAKGAISVHGDSSEDIISWEHIENGVYMRPIIIGKATPEMRIWEEEMFGSVIALATIRSEEEAVKVANSTGYGLSAAIFTEDLKKGLRLAKRLETGAVHINSMTVHDEPALPFGGVKASGWGRFNNAQGLEEFLVTKSVTWMDE